MTAVGYIRQSRRADLDVALSRDAQLAAIRRMCEGCDVLEDMGRSGKAGGERLRPGYRRLMAGIESGEYTEVYAIALSRFSRSVPELHALMELARNRGVRLVTAKEGTMDPHTATGRMIFNTWANFAEFVRDMAVEAANENVAVRRSRGDVMGRRPFGDGEGEDASAVLEAYRRAGSYNGAASILNAAGVRSKLGRLWTSTSVRLVVARMDPGSMPRNPQRGRKSVGGFALFGLLACACGGTLTGQTSHAGKYVRYHCHRADADPSHPRPKSVAEGEVLPWVRAEVERLRLPVDAVRLAADNAERREALAGRLERVHELYIAGAIDRERHEREAAAVAAELATMDATEDVATVPPIQPEEWETWTRADLNGYLRAILERVQLGPDMRPVDALWRNPALRG